MANPLNPIWSMLADRKDKANQKFWTEYRQYGYVTGGTPVQANGYVVLGPDGKIDPSLLPTSGSTVRVNGTAITNPNFNDNLPAAPAGSSNVKWQYDLITGNVSAYYSTSGTSVTFDQILTGDNTSAQMTVSGTAMLTYSGTGVVNANEIGTINVAGNLPTHPGQILISQPGNTSAVWADPQVQGLYAAGSSVASPPAYTPPTTICPVLIGGEDQNGNTTNLQTTVAGVAIVLTQDQETNVNVLRFSATTGVSLVTNSTSTLTPLLSIRPKVGAASVIFTLRSTDFISMGQISHFQLLYNATLTGASFVNADPASNAQYDVSAASYTGGRLIDSGFIGADHERNEFELRFGFTGGVPDIITLVFAPITGSAKTIAGGSMAWDEQAQPL